MNEITQFTNLDIQKNDQSDKIIALVVSPNVGENIASNAPERFTNENQNYRLVNLPSTDSFMMHSAEGNAARDFICFGGADAVIVVCDAVWLERDMNFALQTLEITPHMVVCVSAIEKARKKHIQIDCDQLAKCLSVPVVATNARSGKEFLLLMEKTATVIKKELQTYPPAIRYIRPIEKAISILEPTVRARIGNKLNSRWTALKLIDYDTAFTAALNQYLNCDMLPDTEMSQKIFEAQKYLADCGIFGDALHDNIASCIVLMAEGICNDCVFFSKTARI